METERKNGRGKKEVSLLGLFGKKFLEETQGKLAEATGISFFIIDYKGEPVTKGEKEEKFCKERKKEDEKCSECQIIRGSRLQRENKRKIFVKKGRKKIYAAVSVRLRERLQQRKVQLKTVRIFLLVQMDLFIWRFRLL